MEERNTRPVRGLRQANRGLGVEYAVVVLGKAGHRAGYSGRVDYRIDARQGSAHVLRPRQITDHGAGALHGHFGRPTQQHAKAMAASRQFLQQVLPDKAGCAG
jgi:hypothetical protein